MNRLPLRLVEKNEGKEPRPILKTKVTLQDTQCLETVHTLTEKRSDKTCLVVLGCTLLQPHAMQVKALHSTSIYTNPNSCSVLQFNAVQRD